MPQVLRDLVTECSDEFFVSVKEFLKVALYGGNNTPLSVVIRAIERFTPEVSLIQTYSSTELTGMGTTLPPHDHLARKNLLSAGVVSPNVEVRIVDDDGNLCTASAAGNILMRSDNMTPGYYLNPDATKKLFRFDGWLCTGDHGYLNEEGYLFITGRASHMIVTSMGVNLYPQEVSRVILGHERVSDCAVIGAKSKGREFPEIYAFVVGDVSIGDVIEHCKAYLPEFKVPQHVALVEKIPLNPINAKVRTNELMATFDENRNAAK